MRARVPCSTPYCDNEVFVKEPHRITRENHFCKRCREEHSYYVLITQVNHGYDIRKIILDAAAFFNTASSMGDYVGVSFVTMYHWLQKYFGMTFQEFRRTYICKSTRCYTLDIRGSSYSRNDYIIKKIKSRRYCACVNALDRNQITTNAPISVISEILRGSPCVEKIHDSFYMLVPQPIQFNLVPVYVGLYPISLPLSS